MTPEQAEIALRALLRGWTGWEANLRVYQTAHADAQADVVATCARSIRVVLGDEAPPHGGLSALGAVFGADWGDPSSVDFTQLPLPPRLSVVKGEKP